MMIKEQLIQQLIDMGITPNDTVVVHSSMKAIGEVEGGAETVIEVFSDYLKEGLFIVPTHTWGNVNGGQPVYDRKHTPACIGLIPNTALHAPGGVRSLHPTHSIVAIGKEAANYIKGEEDCTTPAPRGGCWARLYERKAKILLIGVGQGRHTYLHAVEEELGIANRLAKKSIRLEVKDGGKHLNYVAFHPHKHPTLTNMSDRYVKFEKPFAYLGALQYGRFGAAPVQICDAVGCHDIMSMLWKKANYDLTEDFSDVPEEWYMNLKKA